MNRKLLQHHILAVCLVAFASIEVRAWEGNAVGSVAGQSDLYLYNVGAGQWLNASGAWGSQPCVYDVGMPLTITAQGTAYSIQGDIRNPYFADYLTIQSDGCWFDQNLKDGSRWTFTSISTSPQAYTLSATSDGQTYYLRWDGTNRVLQWTTSAPAASDTKAHWQIVTRDDLLDALDDASVGRPKDATFLIKDQNFVFNGKQRSAWVWANASANHFIGINGNDENAASDAQYYNGEVWQDANTISQSLSGLPSGTYLLSAQGFYRNGNVTAATTARQNQTEQIRAFLFAGTAEQPLMSIFDDAGHYDGDLGVATALGQIPDTRTQAGQYFYSGLYSQNSVAFYAGDGGTVSIGLRKEAGSGDWMAFDNFRLTYFGPENVTEDVAELYTGYDAVNPDEFLLDEDSTTFDNLTAYSHRRLVMRRSLDQGKWNSIILPVDLTYSQFAGAFGPETRMARLIGLDEANPERIIFQRLNPQKGQLAVQAGTHYLIYPTMPPTVPAGESYTMKDGTVVSGPLYFVDNVSMEAGQFIVDSLYATSDFSQGLYMMGTYYKRDGSTSLNQKIPAGSYAFARGDLYHIATPQTLKAFRCWMEDMNAAAGEAKAYRISVVDELPTGIDHSSLTIEHLPLNMDVYDLTGRLVANGQWPMVNGQWSTVNGQLKPGLYIIGGKKVLIK